MSQEYYAGTGYSRHHDAHEAGVEATRQALTGRDAQPIACVFVYATVIYDFPKLLQGVASIAGDVPIVGVSTQGISCQQHAEEPDRIVGVATLCSSKLEVRVACAKELSKDSYAAGLALAEHLQPEQGEDPNPTLLWYDPLTGANAEAMLNALAERGIHRVIGGGAGQPWGPMYKTYQFFGGEVLSDSAIALQLDGCWIAYDLTNGVEPLGLEATVTNATENVIHSIDGQPALKVWSEQLGGGRSFEVDDTASWAVGVTPPEGTTYEGPITRAVFGFNEESQEITLQAPIATGTKVQLCHRTPEAVYSRALEMAKRLKQKLSSRQPILALSFECGARPAPFLGHEKARQEVTEIQDILGQDTPWMGFYAWGELAPIGNKSYFHNYTFPLCIICT